MANNNNTYQTNRWLSANPDEPLCNVLIIIYIMTSSLRPEEGSIHVAGVTVSLDALHPTNQNVLHLLGADRINCETVVFIVWGLVC